MIFNNLPKSEIDIVAADGTVRHHVHAVVGKMQFTIPDSMITIELGDEIRRRLPNGTEEVFEVIDHSFFAAFQGIPAHYQVKVRRKGSLPAGQGGNYTTINVNGPNARFNYQSNDYSHNFANEADLFSRLAGVIETVTDAEQKRILQSLTEEMQNAVKKGDGFSGAYQRFIQAAGQHIQLIAPFIPALTQFLGP